MKDTRQTVGSTLVLPAEGAATAAASRGRVNRTVAAMPPSGIRRFFDLVSTMEDVISLGVGEPDFATPWHICKAAIRSIERGHTNYTSNAGMIELRQLVQGWRDAKRTAVHTIAVWLGRAIVALLLIGLAVKTGYMRV